MPKLSKLQLDDLTTLALAIAPELSKEPLYILAGPEERRRNKNVAAQTVTGAIDFRTREQLIKENQWTGPGRVILFFGEFEQTMAEGVLVHEIGHAVDVVVPEIDVEPSPALKRWQEISEYVRVRMPDSDCSLPRWFPNHAAPWLRRTLHLHFRAWAAGFEVPLPYVVDSTVYDLSPAWLFKSTLEDEFRQFEGKRLAEIQATPAPAEFMQLFRDSNQQFQKRRMNDHSR